MAASSCHFFIESISTTSITMKRCSKCGETKDLNEFSKQKDRKDGLRSHCKACVRHNYYKNKHQITERNRKYYLTHKEKCAEYKKRYYQENREKIIEQNKSYYDQNKEKINQNRRRYQQQRLKNDLLFKLRRNLRRGLHKILKGEQKSGSAIDDLGCSVEELKRHLESQFKPGMSWENWAQDGWHVDHILPLSRFDLTKREDLKKACHYTNLQPLWASENLSKNDKTPEE